MGLSQTETKPETSGLLGSVEGVLGKVVGCEGMQEEGEERKGATSGEERLGEFLGGVRCGEES